jgi:AcrR family transcriptional regulator
MGRVSAVTRGETRARLLEAAAREFARRGFEGANVDAISLAAGRGKGTIYNYFASKEELFLAVVEEACAQAIRSASAPTEASTRERLRATLAAFCTWAKANEDFARVLVRECLIGTPALQPHMAAAEEPLLNQLEAVVNEGAARGEVRDDLPGALLALALASMTDLLLAQHWSSDRTNPTLDRIPDLVLDLLLGARPQAHLTS